jgi:2-polyprenyl-3-methyl-5-hydroxy-6-metoxy-1,4-benzoquinol methylase
MKRRDRPEAMDGRDLDPDLLADDLRNLEVLNRLFGGRGVIQRRVLPLLGQMPPGREITALDVGSGAGDLCRALVDGCRSAHQPVQLLSLDAHPQIQQFARENLRAYPEVRFVRGDGGSIPLGTDTVDMSVCTLALHHFPAPEAKSLLAELRRVSRGWTVVSDLSRSRIAYAGVWTATRFTPNPMTRFDGPVSVERAFTAGELMAMAAEAGWVNPKLHREPWFRMTLIAGNVPP